ncbi:MAG: LacI family DNA-binding transcriptional regulator [Fimbriimonadaceae bacterium]
MSDTSGRRRNVAPTLQDIANEAGVSAMAVSVVLNASASSTRVSAATRLRIIEAAKKLRYRPNAVARGLQRRRMDTIGVVGVVDSEEINVYFLELLNGIIKGVDANGQNMMVFSIHDWTVDEARIATFCDGRVDGMLLIAPRPSPRLAQLLPHHTPLVAIHSSLDLPGVPNLSTDSEAGAHDIVKHLLGFGHRRILHIAGPTEVTDAVARINGYSRALKEAGIALDPDLIVPGSYTLSSGRESMGAWLRAHKGCELPTAVFGANDAAAAGAIEALNENGYSLPTDVSVIGFDDSLMARLCNPRLTTLRQPLREMGKRAVELLLGQIETNNTPTSESFPTELVLRDSVVAARTHSIKTK